MLIRPFAAMLMLIGLAPAVDAAEKLVCKTYAVADLVVPIPNYPSAIISAKAKPVIPVNATADKSLPALPDTLIRLITSNVKPETWSSNGGVGTIEYYPIGMAIIVRQSPEVLEDLEQFLAALRKLQDVQVAVEMRVVSVSDTVMKKWADPIGSAGLDPTCLMTNEVRRSFKLQKSIANQKEGDAPIFLNQKELSALLDSAQADRRTVVMQAPKLTMLNGQQASIQAVDEQFFLTGITVCSVDGNPVLVPHNQPFLLGTKFDVRGVVSADNKCVQIKVNGEMSQLCGRPALVPVTTMITPVSDEGVKGQPVPFTQFIQQPNIQKLSFDKTATVSADSTMLIAIGAMKVEERNENFPTFLDEIPYIDQFAKEMGYSWEARHLMLLVTPRVIINTEEVVKPAEAVVGQTFVSPIEIRMADENVCPTKVPPYPPATACPPQLLPAMAQVKNDERQVMLKVTIAEIDRTVAQAMGFKCNEKQAAATAPIVLNNDDMLRAIERLKSNDLARSLAEPNLVTLNGQPASFQAGGSFPVPLPVADAPGLFGVQFVPYGIQLNFTPTIIDRDRIRLLLKTSVNTRDMSAGFFVRDTFAPELTTRNLTTTVEMRDRQMLAFSYANADDERITVMLVKAELVEPAPMPAGVKQATCVVPVPACCTANSAATAGLMGLADVVALSASGISDSIIVNQMRTTGATFRLGTEEILFLKKNGVHDDVIIEMQNSGARTERDSLPPPSPCCSPKLQPCASAPGGSSCLPYPLPMPAVQR